MYDNDPLDDLIRKLMAYLGRLPTEDEVYDFIFGSEEKRQEILRRG